MAAFRSHSQTLEWSNTQKVRGNSVFTSIIGEDESGIYVMRHRNKFISKFVVFERYRHNLGLENSRSYLLKNARILYCDLNESGLFIIKQLFDKKSNSYRITAASFNSAFEPVLPETTFMQIKNTDWDFEPQFIIKPSDNHQNYFIFNYEINRSKDLECQYSTINLKFETGKSGKFILNSNLNIESISDLIIDKNLNFSLLANCKKNIKNLNNFILVEQLGDTNIISQIGDTLHTLEEPILYYNNQKNTKGLSGFYTSSVENGFEGDFLYQWKDLFSDTIKSIKNSFSNAILKDLRGDSKSHTGFLPSTFQTLKVICRSDGGIIKISENAYTQKEQDLMLINGAPSAQGKNIYIFENILIQNFDSMGRLAWENIITKNQNTVNDGGIFGSAFVSATSNAIQIVYNDPIATDGDIVLARFTIVGQKDIKVLAKGDEMNAFIIPSEGGQIASDKIIIPVLKDRKFALLKITFNP